MLNRCVWTVLLLLMLALAGFAAAPTPTETTPVAGEGVFISEVLPGVPGANNNPEFIELYHAGEEPIDAAGRSLPDPDAPSYQRRSDHDPLAAVLSALSAERAMELQHAHLL